MGLSLQAVFIEDVYFRVMDFPDEDYQKHGPKILRKGVAYRRSVFGKKLLLPYRGKVKRGDSFNQYSGEPGLYCYENKDGTYRIRLIPPHTKKQAEEYAAGREKDILAGILEGETTIDQFINVELDPDNMSDAFLPPLYGDDDPLNKLMKTGIRLKNAPFEYYGKRLERSTASRNPSKLVNTKNNTKRGLKSNRNLSVNKFQLYCEAWQLDAAFIIKDAEGSIDPMFEDGTQLIVYPSGKPFEIEPSKLKNLSDVVDPSDYKGYHGMDDDDDEGE